MAEWRRLGALLAVLMLMPACGGSSGKKAGGVAQAVRIDAAVDVALGGDNFAAVSDPVDVAIGDLVHTDDKGFAEVRYRDGSLTRLDVDSQFKITELTDKAGATITRTEMSAGRTWNRVEKLAGDGEFEVDTSVATATVRGTAFVIDCRDKTRCTFTAVEGAILVKVDGGQTVELKAPSTITVENGKSTEPQSVGFDAVFGDPWVNRNGTLDGGAGLPGPGEIFQAHGPATASLEGDYTNNEAVRAFDCDAGCPSEFPPPLGETRTSTLRFDADCRAVPCSIVVSGADWIFGSNREQLEFDGRSYRVSFPFVGMKCDDLLSGERLVQVDGAGQLVITPTAASIRDGRYVVTNAAIEWTLVGTVVVDRAPCPGADFRGYRHVTRGELTS